MRGLLIIGIIFINDSILSQESLILNGSFEELFSCIPNQTTLESTIEFALGWSSPTNSSTEQSFSPDLFNSCSSSLYGMPNNWYGYQNAIDGAGYAGLYLHGFPVQGASREFIQSELANNLFKNCKYKLSFYVSYGSQSSYRTSSLFFLFSNNEITITNNQAFSDYSYFDFSPESLTVVHCPEVWNADTANWFYIEKEFYSNSDAQYVTIGNIADSANTTYEFAWHTYMGGITNGSAIYIDDIKLIQLDSNCTTGIKGNIDQNWSVFPNPADNSLFVKIPDNKNAVIFEFIDLSGRINNRIDLGPSQLYTLDVSDIPNGFWLLRIQKSDSHPIVKPIFIQH